MVVFNYFRVCLLDVVDDLQESHADLEMENIRKHYEKVVCLTRKHSN